jgi:hypothetical protein
MLRGDLAVDHAALDNSSRLRPTAVLRARLVGLGLLESRDERIAEVQRAAVEAVEHAHSGDAGALARFGRWVVLHGVAVRIERGKGRLGTSKAAKAKLRRVALLLTDLRRDDIALADLTQPWIDEWVHAHPSARPDIRAFIGWACQQGIVSGPVEVDPATSTDVRLELDEDTRRDLLVRLLHDDMIEASDRVAGILLVGLGQPLTRIVALTVGDVSCEEPTRLTLGTRPLQMPPPLDGLLRELVSTAAFRGTDWLFVGHPGHMTPERLSERLAKLGITNMLSARNAAWAALAAETPAVVLAEKLGGSVSAAEKWAQAVASGRDVYAGLRVSDE